MRISSWPAVRYSLALQPSNLLKHFRSGSNVGSEPLPMFDLLQCTAPSSALKLVTILKKKFYKELYIFYIRITDVLSTCFCNFFPSTNPIALEPWNLHPSCRIECSIHSATSMHYTLGWFFSCIGLSYLFFWMPVVPFCWLKNFSASLFFLYHIFLLEKFFSKPNFLYFFLIRKFFFQYKFFHTTRPCKLLANMNSDRDITWLIKSSYFKYYNVLE